MRPCYRAFRWRDLGLATCLPNRVDHASCAAVLDCSGGIALGTSYWTFGDQYLDTYCDAGCTADLSAVCDGDFGTTTEPDDGDCAFNAEAAVECVDVRNWECESLIDGSSDTYPTPPSVCGDTCG